MGRGAYAHVGFGVARGTGQRRVIDMPVQAPLHKEPPCDPHCPSVVLWPQVAIRAHPLAGRWSFYTLLSVSYLSLFSLYWLAALVGGWAGTGWVAARRVWLDFGALAACQLGTGCSRQRACTWCPRHAPPPPPPRHGVAVQAHLLYESRDLAEVRRFCNDTLGIR